MLVGEVTAFRLAAHHLERRRPAADVLAVAGICGVQNSPPGSALLSLHARAEGVTRDGFDHLIAQDKSLLQSWCMRGAPFVFPTADAPVFTTGALPTTQAARLHLIAGLGPALTRLDLGLDEAVDLAAAEVPVVLSGRRLAIGALGRQLADRVEGNLAPAQRVAWRAIGPYAADQPLGEAVMHFCLRILTLRGLVCMARREGNVAPFVLVDEWLGHALPTRDPQDCRAELLRRYLHCYGPSTRSDFAAWLGVRTGEVDPWWGPMAEELTPVEIDGSPAWILADDLPALRSPRPAMGVRLLPPGDPYLQARDRRIIVAADHHGEVWRSAGSPGAVLADGAIVGTWRPRKRGQLLTLTVRAFRSLDASLRQQVQAEAEAVASLRGAPSVEVVFERGS